MIDKIANNIRKKSLKERFLLVIGILLFLSYLTLGLIFIFWQKFPINMERKYRIAFGLLLIIYSGIRFSRIIKDNKETDDN